MQTGPPSERGSIRSVRVQGRTGTFDCEVRTLHGSGLRPGDLVWVEFGAYWTEIQGQKTRHRGQWRQCVVLPTGVATSADVYVRFSPDPTTAPSELG